MGNIGGSAILQDCAGIKRGGADFCRVKEIVESLGGNLLCRRVEHENAVLAVLRAKSVSRLGDHDAIDEALNLALALQADDDPEGIKGAQVTAAAIFLARTGKSKEEIRDYIEGHFGYDLHKTYAYWYKRYDWDESCQGTVPQALICFLESEDYEDAIRKAIALGGDSDTLACITGGIAEAYHRLILLEMANEALIRLPESMKDTLKAFGEASHYDCRIAYVD